MSVINSEGSSLFMDLSLECALRENGCRIGYEPTKNELRSLSAVDIQGHQCGGFCIVQDSSNMASLKHSTCKLY